MESAWTALAAFAWDWFKKAGRGLVAVEVEEASDPGRRDPIYNAPGTYWTLQPGGEYSVDFDDSPTTQALKAALEDYDPEKEIIVAFLYPDDTYHWDRYGSGHQLLSPPESYGQLQTSYTGPRADVLIFRLGEMQSVTKEIGKAGEC